MLFRFCLCFKILLSVIFSLPISQALAQREDMSIGDEPGVIPNAADEQLPLQFRRQVVLYRSTEAPGTIIVQTAERFLYVVQPGGRALRYGIGVGREGPMGARALYLGSTVYRIHGTNQPKTIGTAVSSGCFRLVNGDVTDLYDRIPVGTKVIVRQKPEL
jgi:lipoprotein-anchoring transpeptidase ErfK/SrfK